MIFRIINKLLLPATMLLFSALLSGCSEEESTELIPNETSTEDTVATVGRSVLVYLLADNTLGAGGYDRSNLADMIDAAEDGLLGNNRLIIYHDDKNSDYPMLKEVTPKGLKVLKIYDHSERSVSSVRMTQVIADFKATAPAKRYGLILWSHASGWLQNGMAESQQVSTQSFGDDRSKYMNITTLANTLDGKGFDYIYFDCCHMASVESLYELRNVADKFAGSCAELPAAGMPYKEALPYLIADEADLEGAARSVYEHYNAFTGSDRTATMSVIDASGLDRLAQATGDIYELHPTLPDNYSVQEFERTKSNGEPCYLFDFEDYITGLYNNSGDLAMRSLYANWLLALDNCVTYQAATPYIFSSIKVNAHCGLSTYILRSRSDADVKNYHQLSWFNDVASKLFADEQRQ